MLRCTVKRDFTCYKGFLHTYVPSEGDEAILSSIHSIIDEYNEKLRVPKGLPPVKTIEELLMIYTKENKLKRILDEIYDNIRMASLVDNKSMFDAYCVCAEKHMKEFDNVWNNNWRI